MKHTRFGMAFAAAVACTAMSGTTYAQSIDYPVDTVRIVVPQSAGGGTDANARLFAEYLGKYTGASVAVVNQKAGGGVVAQQTVLTGDTDGSQLYFNHAADHVGYQTGKTPFKYDEFKPLATTAMLSDVLLARQDMPFDTLAELIDYAKKNPNTLTYVTQFGGTTEVKADAINNATGGALRVVDGGSGADRIVLLLGGNAQLSAEGVNFAKERVGSGSLKPIAVLTEERDPLVPDWPTAKEQGFDISLPYVFTLYGPKDMDTAAVEAIDKVVEALKQDKEYAQRLETLNQSPALRNSSETEAFLPEEFSFIEQYSKANN